MDLYARAELGDEVVPSGRMKKVDGGDSMRGP